MTVNGYPVDQTETVGAEDDKIIFMSITYADLTKIKY